MRKQGRNLFASALITAQLAGISPSAAETNRRLHGRIKLLQLSPKTRQFYRTYRWQGRYRNIRRWLWVVAFLDLAYGGIDFFIMDAAPFRMLIVARLIESITFVMGAFTLRKFRGSAVEGFCVIGPCTFMLFATGFVGLHCPPGLLERYAVNTWFAVGSGIVYLQLDFLYTCLLASLAILVPPIFILASDISPEMVKVEIVLFHVGAIAALWNAQRIQLVHHYRGTLLSLKNELQAEELGELARQLREVADTDQLTGIANRRRFNETCAALKSDLPIAVAMIDIDHFKSLNDSLGHLEGDRAIRMVADSINGSIRPGDMAARYGGEEFVVLVKNADTADIRALAERIRCAVAALSGPSGHGLTVSIGVAVGCGAEQASILHQADVALYAAKNFGRNQVVVADAIDADTGSPGHQAAVAAA